MYTLGWNILGPKDLCETCSKIDEDVQSLVCLMVSIFFVVLEIDAVRSAVGVHSLRTKMQEPEQALHQASLNGKKTYEISAARVRQVNMRQAQGSLSEAQAGSRSLLHNKDDIWSSFPSVIIDLELDHASKYYYISVDLFLAI